MERARNEGLLVVIEGIDGGGKTTLQRGIADTLRRAGYEVVETKEPTNGPIGQQIRSMAAGHREATPPEEEFRLFHEDRRTHVESVVRPALANGVVVVQDRSFFSTAAYQGERGLDRDALLEKSRAIAPEPDVLLVVDLPATVALERIRAGRDGQTDDFERHDTLERLRSVFAAFPSAHVLDGTQDPAALLEAALSHVNAVLTGA